MNLWRFESYTADAGTELTAILSHQLGPLSGALAVIGAYSLFAALDRMAVADSTATRNGWTLAGSICMALGFWAMESLNMMGLRLPVALSYDLVTGLLSLVPIAIGCGVVIATLSRDGVRNWQLHVAALAISLGMLGLLFVFMEALVMPAHIQYQPAGIALALGVGYAWCILALYLLRFLHKRRKDNFWSRLFIAGIFALAALGVHFGGMSATHFYLDAGATAGASGVPPEGLVPILVISVLVSSGMLWISSMVDTRMSVAVNALRQSEARNRAVIDAMPDAHVIFDGRGIVVSFNPAAERIFGTPHHDIIGKSVATLMSDEGRERFAAWAGSHTGLEAHMPMSKRLVREAGARRRNGSVFPVEYTISSVPTHGGIEYSCVLRDLTDQWKAQSRMETLANAVESSGDGIMILDSKRVITYVNPQFMRQSGFPLEELVGHKAFIGENEPDGKFQEVWTELEQGRSWSGHVRPRRPDGTRYEEEAVITPVRDVNGNVYAYVAVLRDVTERIRRDFENERLAAAIRYSADSIEILDSDGRFVYVNPAVEQRRGMKLAQMRGRRPEELSDVTVVDTGYREMMRSVRERGQTWAGQLRTQRANGLLADEEVTISPITDDRGGQTSYVVIKRDITDKKRMESQLQRAQKLEAIGQLAAGIAHEINTPTQYVGDNLRFLRDSFIEMLGKLEKVAPAEGHAPDADLDFLREEIPRAVDQSIEGCERIANIVKAMKEFSHPSHDMQAADLNKAVQSTITVATSEWKYVAEVKTDLDPALPLVVCQLGEVNQVVLNMIVNAAHAIAAAAAGEAKAKGTIGIATRRTDEGVQISISDSGTGIPPEIRDRIFDPFFTTKPVGKGTGQGLAIAHDVIVRKHHGSIDVESAPGQGTTFILRLPAKQPGSDTAKAA